MSAPRRIVTLDVRTRAQWRAWLRKHHRKAAEIWLVFHKQHTGTRSVDHEAAVEEALCFGWIDSLVRQLDDERFARKFTPRKPDSRWSASNLRRYAAIEARGLLTEAGRARAPTRRMAVAPRRRDWPMPPYMQRALEANPRARRAFEGLAPSYRRKYIGWIDSAKHAETKERRLREALTLLVRGEKLGLK